jgi:hypothetical protein
MLDLSTFLKIFRFFQKIPKVPQSPAVTVLRYAEKRVSDAQASREKNFKNF